MKLKASSTINFVGGFLIATLIVGSLSFKGNNDNVAVAAAEDKSSNSEAKFTPPKLPTQLSFAGEKVPLEKWDVKERLDREVMFNYFNTANLLHIMKMANRHFPTIEARLKAHGVPDDFKYLAIAESNLFANAISRSGAVGFWQFMDGTAPAYGLTSNNEIDLRRDLEKSTDGAANYLKQAYAKFNSWTAAAASYNMGQGGYNGQATYQGSYNYYDLMLPEETNRYIFRILAFKHLLENANQLGFHLEEDEKYHEVAYRNVTVTSSIPNLAQFAKNNGTNYRILRLMNPWLKSRSLTVKPGTTYTIKVPK